MINKYNDEAIRSHTRIINFGGFVSSPMDCGVRNTIQYMKKRMEYQSKRR